MIRPAASDTIFRSKVEVLLGDRDPKSPQRAIRWGELNQALQSNAMTSIVARVVERGVGEQIKTIETELGQITVTQSFVAAYQISEMLIHTEKSEADRQEVASVTVSGFKAGTFFIQYSAYADNLHRTNSFGTAALLVNGVEVDRKRFGVDVTEAPSRFALPLTLGGIFTGTATSFTIGVQAWTSDPDDPAATSGGFYLRSSKVLISGGVS